MARSAPTPQSSGQWRVFLRALTDEIDWQGGERARDELLRGVGRRMAQLMPLPQVASLEALEIEMNEALDQLGWGAVRLTVSAAEHKLTIVHTDLPRIGAAGNPPGQWLSAALEGLYDAWIAQDPASDIRFVARRSALPTPTTIELQYGKI